MHSKNTAKKIVNHLEEVAVFEQVENKLLSLQQLVADYNSGNEYLANKKYLNNWYYIEVKAQELHAYSYEDEGYVYLEAPFFNENGSKYEVEISTSDTNVTELHYPRQMIFLARFTYLSSIFDTIQFKDARLVFCERD